MAIRSALPGVRAIASYRLLETLAHVSVPRIAKVIDRSSADEPCGEFIAIETSDQQHAAGSPRDCHGKQEAAPEL